MLDEKWIHSRDEEESVSKLRRLEFESWTVEIPREEVEREGQFQNKQKNEN